MFRVRKTIGAVRRSSGRRRPMLRGLAVSALVVGSLVSLTGTAQAYNQATCNTWFGASQVQRVDLFRINHREGDFGDTGHSWGAPEGTAVVCFATGGRVMVKGRLFADAVSVVTVRVRFDYFNAGAPVGLPFETTHRGSWASSKAVQDTRSGVDEVRVKTFDANGRASVSWISLRNPPPITTIPTP